MKKEPFLLVVTLGIILLQCKSSSCRQFKRVRGASSRVHLTHDQLAEVQDTIRLVSEGEAAISRHPNNVKEYVLVIGNTGAGKTTITKFLNQPEKLESYDAGDRFLIREINQTTRHRESTLVSKTLYPDLIIDPRTGTAFYDLPGFSDTRNASVEIANSWFMKKVAERAEKVKILFIVNYSSLRNGEIRNAFKNLIDHATNFIQNPRKFGRSIAMIATKVDVVADPEVIHSVIRDFLEQTLSSLDQIFDDPQKIQNAQLLINSFLTESRSGMGLARVAYFQQPKTAAALTSFPALMEIQRGMWTIIKKLRWTTVQDGDFGLSLSPSARLLVERSGGALYSKLSGAVSNITQKIQTFFESQAGPNASHPIGTIYWLQDQFESSIPALRNASGRSEFFEIAADMVSVSRLHIPHAAHDFIEIAEWDKSLGILEELSETVLPPPIDQWTRSFAAVVTANRRAIKNLTTRFNSDMEQRLNRTSYTLQADILGQVEHLNRSESVQVLQHYSDDMEHFIPLLATSPTYNEFIYCLHELFNATSSLEVYNDTEHDLSLDPKGKDPSPFHLLSWIRPLERLGLFLKDEIATRNLSHKQEHFNRTLEALTLNQTELEQELELQLQVSQQQLMDLHQNSTQEEQRIQGEIHVLRQQHQLNSTLHQEATQRQLDQLKQSHTQNTQNLVKTLEVQTVETDTVTRNLTRTRADLQRGIAETRKQREYNRRAHNARLEREEQGLAYWRAELREQRTLNQQREDLLIQRAQQLQTQGGQGFDENGHESFQKGVASLTGLIGTVGAILGG